MTQTIGRRATFFTVYGFMALILIVLISAVVLMILRSAQAAGAFTLSSPDITEGTLSEDQVFNGFGCAGKNISPALNWSGAPDGTQSFAVTVYDPDAPTGSGWWHWVIFDIPANTNSLPTGVGSEGTSLPKHVRQANNDYGTANFGGACPPKADKPHRYIFTVYALPVEHLNVPATASPALIGYQLKTKKLAEASFTAMYGR